MTTHLVRKALVLTALSLLAAGCGTKSQAATLVAPPARPEGEVWLTPAQVADAKIQLMDVTPQAVDDTILTSGTVTLDDQRTGHVFSPVTGRVVQHQCGSSVST